MLNEEPRTKPWPVRETQKLAAEAITAVEHGDTLGARRLTIKLLEKHQAYMVPFGERWIRSMLTIDNLKAQE
jgi:hypothetical protein